MILQGILIGLIAGYGRIEQSWLGQQMIARPIWLCPLVGLVLGDFQKGLIIGGTLELIWMGVVQIGATPAEVVSGSVIASALAIKNGMAPEEAVALAIPIAMLAVLAGTLITTTNSFWTAASERAVENADTKKLYWIGLAGGFTYLIIYFIITFAAFVFGSGAVQAFVNSVPPIIKTGLTNASKMLPAIGIATLLRFTLDNKYAGFFIIGFALASYGKLGTMAIAIVGGAFAYIYYQLKPNAEVE
ncbi:MAG: PTS sugar transporter subunit IIC [Bacillota bacterium]|nr:PTS sugar transporter subunit IIC [Bacillota bacterium]